MGVFALIFGSTLLHSLWSLGALLAIAALLALSVRLPARRLARVWLGVPLFSLAIILPAATNLVTPGSDRPDPMELRARRQDRAMGPAGEQSR